MQVRRATATDAATLAALLDAFNREFGTPTPGPAVLEARLRILLADAGQDASTIAYLADAPAAGSDAGSGSDAGAIAHLASTPTAGSDAGAVEYLTGTPAGGFALLTARPNVWYPGPVLLLDELYVRPELRGRGLGSALLERFVADAITSGASALEITVDEPDTAARRFYERHGFTSTDPATGDRALYYSRDL